MRAADAALRLSAPSEASASLVTTA